ncbi:MAG: DUF4293 family protein [Brumimicrobium sp.]
MIYRVQTFYLFIATLALISLTFGIDVFSTNIIEKEQFELTSHANIYGIQKDLVLTGELDTDNLQFLRESLNKVDVEEVENHSTYSNLIFYIFPFVMILLSIGTIGQYKNLKKQLGLARFLVVLNLLLFGLTLYAYYQFINYVSAGVFEINTVNLSLGFYSICISVAFSILAVIGIKRDYKLIKSIDRIR